MQKIIISSLIILALGFSQACKNQSGDSKETAAETEESSEVFSPASLRPAEYIDWVENPSNGLITDKTIGDLTFSAFYKPLEYVALKDLGQDSLSKLNGKLKEYEGMEYFSFRIQSNKEQEELLKKDLRNENEYYARLEYFSFRMQQDFKLISGSDTAECALFHYERVYGLAPHASFVLGFPKKKDGTKAAKQLLFEDKIFNRGNVYITLSREKINRIPKLEM